MAAIDTFEAQALNLLTSPEAREAFDLNREPAHVRDRYGRHRWGQQCLMARRLVEAGVEIVTTTLDGPICGRVQNWDDHGVNQQRVRGLPPPDAVLRPGRDGADRGRVCARAGQARARGRDGRVRAHAAGRERRQHRRGGGQPARRAPCSRAATIGATRSRNSGPAGGSRRAASSARPTARASTSPTPATPPATSSPRSTATSASTPAVSCCPISPAGRSPCCRTAARESRPSAAGRKPPRRDTDVPPVREART